MAQVTDDYLGIGIYSPAEAALYARERTSTVVRWVLGNKRSAPVLNSQLDPSARLVTFLDFVQMLAVSAIRRQYGVPLQTIRQGLENAKERYAAHYPFAVEHKTYLFERGSRKRGSRLSDQEAAKRFEIVIRVGDDQLVQVTGKDAHNLMIKEVVELYTRDLYFGHLGLAEEYYPWRERGIDIKMNPHLHFGEPLLPSGYTALALAEAVTVEGGIERAAKAYGVDPMEVEVAFKYVTSLQPPPPRDK